MEKKGGKVKIYSQSHHPELITRHIMDTLHSNICFRDGAQIYVHIILYNWRHAIYAILFDLLLLAGGFFTINATWEACWSLSQVVVNVKDIFLGALLYEF